MRKRKKNYRKKKTEKMRKSVKNERKWGDKDMKQ